MSSNGPIPPSMNPMPSGASAYDPEQTACAIRCIIAISGWARCAPHQSSSYAVFFIAGAYEVG